jgi:uncharacterized protein YozE (UPF0346 family)
MQIVNYLLKPRTKKKHKQQGSLADDVNQKKIYTLQTKSAMWQTKKNAE